MNELLTELESNKLLIKLNSKFIRYFSLLLNQKMKYIEYNVAKRA